MVAAIQISFDAADPRRLGTFWAEVLGYVEQPPPAGFHTWDAYLDSIDLPAEEREQMYSVVDPAGAGPRLLFQTVPEGKTAKNRIHLDVNVAAGHPPEERIAIIQARAAELVGLGATLVEERVDELSHWIVMLDPEGNEFCLQ